MRSNTEWRMWGKADPLWSDASWEGKQKSGREPWTDAEFYELGRSDWSDFWKRWKKYSSVGGAAVEIGCGAGRLTKHIAESFSEVHAIDVSADMVGYARVHVPTVIFHVVNGTAIPLQNASVDAAFSAHVFQHLDGLDGAVAYFKEIARVLRPGGSMMIHLPVSAWPSGTGKAIKALYRLRRFAISVRAAWMRRVIRHGRFVRFMTSQSFPIEYLHAQLPQLGFSDVEISIITTRSNNAIHPFVLAIKS